MSDGIGVEFIAGRYVLVIPASPDLEVLLAFVHQAATLAHHNNRLPVPAVAPFVRAGRRALALARMVPTAEPALAESPGVGGRWGSTVDAGRLLEIGERAVRKRISSGRLEAQRIGGCWLVDLTKIIEEIA